MISIKDYAKQNNVTYEAVRQQIKRYREQLDDHIIQDGRTQYLDDIAVAFLDERRQKNPVVVYQAEKDEQIEQLRCEKEELLIKLANQGEVLIGLMQYKLEQEKKRGELEDAKTAQERRERELQAREDGFTQELATARQEASEEAQKAAEEKAAKELAQEKEKYEAELTAAQKELAEKDKKIQELENRSIWQILKEHLRKKKE